MARPIKSKKNQSVQFLFTLVLFLGLVLCSVFVITFGARVYENVGQRMEENFTGTTASGVVRSTSRAAAVAASTAPLPRHAARQTSNCARRTAARSISGSRASR